MLAFAAERTIQCVVLRVFATRFGHVDPFYSYPNRLVQPMQRTAKSLQAKHALFHS
jgi:hypothetical protein